MSFHLNNEQQMAINDALLSFTERETKYLKDSWAETFSKKIFPFIDEDRFSVLYSDNPATRPNNPAKVYLGFKISAINCKRLIKGLINRPIPEFSTLLYNYLFSLFSFQMIYRVKLAA